MSEERMRWEARYAEAAVGEGGSVWSGRVNAALRAVVEDHGLVPDAGATATAAGAADPGAPVGPRGVGTTLGARTQHGGGAVGRSLDIGCGEGGDALWLASRGWEATGADFAVAAVDRARAEADRRKLDAQFVVADAATADGLAALRDCGPYGLVTVCFLHVAPEELPRVYRPLLELVAPGGSLVVVAHHPRHADLGAGGPAPERLLDPETLLSALGLGLPQVAPSTAEPLRDGTSHKPSGAAARADTPMAAPADQSGNWQVLEAGVRARTVAAGETADTVLVLRRQRGAER